MNEHEYPLRYYTPMNKDEDCDSDAPDVATSSNRQRRIQIRILLSCFILTFTGCGFNFAFGVYQEHYEIVGGPFKDAAPADIDLIGTLAASLMTVGAPFAAAWTKAFSARSVTAVGALLFAVAGVTASQGTQVWHFQLTQGVVQGCAACLTYIPAVTIAPTFFTSKRGLAMGLILSGTGLGGMAWAPFLRYLITTIGFRKTLATSGVIASVTIAASAMFLGYDGETKTHAFSPRSKSRWTAVLPSFNTRLIWSPLFLLHSCGGALHSAAYFLPIYFMSSYARNLGFSDTSGALIIALSDCCNSAGKIAFGYMADSCGRLRTLIGCTSVSMILTFGLWCTSSMQIPVEIRSATFVAYAALYGLTAGVYVSLFPTVLAEHFGIREYPNINGVLYMIRGLGTLTGTSFGAALIVKAKDRGQLISDFDPMLLFVAVCLLGATVSMSCTGSRSVRIF